jgi:hypothetical protein
MQLCGFAISRDCVPDLGRAVGLRNVYPPADRVDCYYRLAFCIARIDRTEASAPDPESAMKLRLLELPGSFTGSDGASTSSRVFEKLHNAFAFSTVVLLRFGAKNFQVSGTSTRVNIGRLVLVEWIIGIFLLVDLAYTLQSQPFIQRIVGALG